MRSGSLKTLAGIWWNYAAKLCPRLRSHITNISLLRKSVEDARKDAKLWPSRSEGDDTVDVNFLWIKAFIATSQPWPNVTKTMRPSSRLFASPDLSCAHQVVLMTKEPCGEGASFSARTYFVTTFSSGWGSFTYKYDELPLQETGPTARHESLTYRDLAKHLS